MKLIRRCGLTLTMVAACTMAGAQEAGAPQWVNISDALVKEITDSGAKIAWPGQTAGITVDRTTGHVYLVIPGQGLWRSTDRGRSYTRCDEKTVSGRCETGYSLNSDPAGQRLACFMLDGKCAMTLDGGKTWHAMKDVGRNWDYAAVDWSDPEAKAIFAARHESGGEMYLSTDAGKTWKMIGKDKTFAAVGIFDEKTLVTTKGEGILRSTDGGQTWTKVSDFQPVGRVAIPFRGATWWLAKEGLIITTDKGATWTRRTAPVEAAWGPMFGKDEKHIVVAGNKGFFETTDGGETWKLAAPLPPDKEFRSSMPGWFLNVAWDPNADVFYASRMGRPAYKFERRP